MPGRDEWPERVGRFWMDAAVEAAGHTVMFVGRSERGQPGIVKIVPRPADDHTDPLRTTRFLEEAARLRELSHPGLVRVLDAGVEEGCYFLVFESIDGRALSELLVGVDVDFGTLLAIALEVADTLVHLHEAGITVRDLEPTNIVIDRRGRAVIAGVALSALLRLRPEEMVLGTPGYLAPELLLGLSPSALSDQFAFGRLLVSLAGALGPTPITAGSVRDQLAADPVDWSRFPRAPGFDELRPIIERLTQRRAAERYPSMTDALDGLVQLALAQPHDGIEDTLPMRAVTRKPPPPPPRKRSIVVASGDALTIAVEDVASVAKAEDADRLLSNLRLTAERHRSDDGAGLRGGAVVGVRDDAARPGAVDAEDAVEVGARDDADRLGGTQVGARDDAVRPGPAEVGACDDADRPGGADDEGAALRGPAAVPEATARPEPATVRTALPATFELATILEAPTVANTTLPRRTLPADRTVLTEIPDAVARVRAEQSKPQVVPASAEPRATTPLVSPQPAPGAAEEGGKIDDTKPGVALPRRPVPDPSEAAARRASDSQGRDADEDFLAVDTPRIALRRSDTNADVLDVDTPGLATPRAETSAGGDDLLEVDTPALPRSDTNTDGADLLEVDTPGLVLPRPDTNTDGDDLPEVDTPGLALPRSDTNADGDDLLEVDTPGLALPRSDTNADGDDLLEVDTRNLARPRSDTNADGDRLGDETRGHVVPRAGTNEDRLGRVEPKRAPKRSDTKVERAADRGGAQVAPEPSPASGLRSDPAATGGRRTRLPATRAPIAPVDARRASDGTRGAFASPAPGSSASTARMSAAPGSPAAASHARTSSAPDSPARTSSAPASSARTSSAPDSPAPVSPARTSSAPDSSVSASPARTSSAPDSSVSASPARTSSAPDSSVSASPAWTSSAPDSSAAASSVPASSTAASPASPTSDAGASSAPTSPVSEPSGPKSSAPKSSGAMSSAPLSSGAPSPASGTSIPMSSGAMTSAPASSAPASRTASDPRGRFAWATFVVVALLVAAAVAAAPFVYERALRRGAPPDVLPVAVTAPPRFVFRGRVPVDEETMKRAAEYHERAGAALADDRVEEAERALGICIELADRPECHRTLAALMSLTGDPAAGAHLARYLELTKDPALAERLRSK